MEISNDGLEARRIEPLERVFYGYDGAVYSERPVRGHVEFEVEIIPEIIEEIIPYSTFLWLGSLRLGVMLRKSQTSLWDIAPPVSTMGAYNHCVWDARRVHDDVTTMEEMPYSEDLADLKEGDRLGLLITSDGELYFLVNGESRGRATYGIYRPGYDVYIAVDHHGNLKATRITRASKPVLLSMPYFLVLA